MNIKKDFLVTIALVFICIFCVFSTCMIISLPTVFAEGEEGTGEGTSDTSGYTEEQKAAAKAWLSAHGYAPTRAGAAQAYADYLAGKLDNDPDVRRYKGLDDETEDSDASNADLPDIDTSESGVHLDDSEDKEDSQEKEVKTGQASNDYSGDDISFDNLTSMIDSEDESYDIGSDIKESQEKLIIPQEKSSITLSYHEKDNPNYIWIMVLAGVIVIIGIVFLLKK